MGNPEVYFLSCSATNARCCYGGTTLTCKALNYKGLLQLAVWRMEEKWVKASPCTQKPYPCRSRAGMWRVTGSESKDSNNSFCAERAQTPALLLPNLQALLATTDHSRSLSWDHSWASLWSCCKWPQSPCPTTNLGPSACVLFFFFWEISPVGSGALAGITTLPMLLGDSCSGTVQLLWNRCAVLSAQTYVTHVLPDQWWGTGYRKPRWPHSSQINRAETDGWHEATHPNSLLQCALLPELLENRLLQMVSVYDRQEVGLLKGYL